MNEYTARLGNDPENEGTRVVQLSTFNPEKPTNPASYVALGQVTGLPLGWQDDVTGGMQDAVMAYLNQRPTREELRLVIAYIQHHIHAPCFLEEWPFPDDDEERIAQVRALREKAMELTTLEDVNEYINQALEIGLDPL